MGGKDELLVELFEETALDPEALSGRRTRTVRRKVVLTTGVLEPVFLHWGVARDEPGQWLLPAKELWPEGTFAVSPGGTGPPKAAETPFQMFEGCMRPEEWGAPEAGDEARHAAAAAPAFRRLCAGCLNFNVQMHPLCRIHRTPFHVYPPSPDLIHQLPRAQVCYPLQQLVVELPGDGDDELMGIQFVIRSEDNVWYKDPSSGNFKATFSSGLEAVPMDELTERIVRVEGGNGWWSLMHRFKLASELINEALNGKRPVGSLFKLFVWLRYSSGRHLTWQRNYNVKPRELASAQSGLGFLLANTYVKRPTLREPLRLMLGTLGRGGDGGSGQAIRDEILNIMHRNGIGEDKGIWMEQWHQKLHNNTTPDDVVICEAYLAFLRANMSIKEYWRVLGENNITKQLLASYERPIITEPLPRMGLKDRLIADFTKYLNILKSVHSGADLTESIRRAVTDTESGNGCWECEGRKRGRVEECKAGSAGRSDGGRGEGGALMCCARRHLISPYRSARRRASRSCN